MYLFFHKIAVAISAGLVSLASLFAPVQTPAPTPINLGAGVVQARSFTLSGSGVTASATSITLNSFKLPDASTTIVITDFQGSVGYGTLEPGTSREESISFSGVTQNSNGTAILTGVTRGLDFRGNNCGTAVSANQKAHAGGAVFILSNTACYYSNFPTKSGTETITGSWRFASTSLPKVATNTTIAQQAADTSTLASVAYVNQVASSGAPAAQNAVAGIVYTATSGQLFNSAASNTYPYVPTSDLFSGTPSSSVAYQIPVAQSGTIPVGYINNTSPTFNALTATSASITSATSGLWQANASGTPSALTPGTSGNIVQSNGSVWVAASSTMPSRATTSTTAVTTIGAVTQVISSTFPNATASSSIFYAVRLPNNNTIATYTIRFANSTTTMDIATCSTNPSNSGGVTITGQAWPAGTNQWMYSSVSNVSGCTSAGIGTINLGSSPSLQAAMAAAGTSSQTFYLDYLYFQ